MIPPIQFFVMASHGGRRHRYLTREAAHKAAAQLAELNPGVQFGVYVLDVSFCAEEERVTKVVELPRAEITS